MYRSYRDIVRAAVPSSRSTDAQESEQETYNCEFCDEGWQSESEVFIHKRSHASEVNSILKEKKEVCLLCITSFESKSQLTKHIKSTHLLSSEDARCVEREIFVCHYCEYIFFNKGMLVIHMAKVHKRNKKTDLLECPKCKRKVYPAYLWSHFSHHQMQSIACCPICFKKCKNRNDLEDHVQCHPQYLYCHFCNKHMRTLHQFYQHLKIHSSKTFQEKSVSSARKYFIPHVSKVRWAHHKINPYTGLTLQKVKICVLCREICHSKRKMMMHVKKHQHSIKPPPKSDIKECKCGLMFTNKVLLAQHKLKRACEVPTLLKDMV